MMLLPVVLLLHPGSALISVTTVELGKPATFTCLFPDAEYSNTRVKWYKQRPGDTLALIATLMKASLKPTVEEEFRSRFSVDHSKLESSLTIYNTIPADEAIYHCAVTTWSKDQWSGSHLVFTGNSEQTSNYSVVQTPSVSDPVRPGDSVTLQCSVLSASGNTTCPGGHSVSWFRAGSDQSPPGIIYTGGNSKCEQRSDSVKSCVYRFSKTISSSDAGTYHCAVASCGHILFGEGTTLNIDGSMRTALVFRTYTLPKSSVSYRWPVIFSIVAVPVAAAAFLVCVLTETKCDCWNEKVLQRNLKRRDDPGIYSAAVFTVATTDRDTKSVERKRIYAAANALGMN